MPHLRCAFRRAKTSPLPTDSPSTMPPLPRLPRAFHAVSLAATNIVSRTTFVVCVPIASATPSSLPGRIGFTNTLRVITALSVPHSVANGSVPTPSGSHAPSVTATNQGWIYAYTFGIALHHSHFTSAIKLSKSKSSHRGVTRSVGGVRLPWVFVPHPTNGTPMDKNANRPRTPPTSRRFTVGKIPKCTIFHGKP